MRLELQRWLSVLEHLLHLQRVQIGVPAPTWRLSDVCDISSRGYDTLLWPMWASGTHIVPMHAGKTAIYIKC